MSSSGSVWVALPVVMVPAADCCTMLVELVPFMAAVMVAVLPALEVVPLACLPVSWLLTRSFPPVELERMLSVKVSVAVWGPPSVTRLP